MDSNRLLIVSNRLPVTAQVTGGHVHLTAAGGGLATGPTPWHEQSEGLWIGSTLTVAVGSGPTDARYRLGDYRAVRRTLRTLVDAADSVDGLDPIHEGAQV